MKIKTDDQGRTIYYPWAGRGRIIRNSKDLHDLSSLQNQIVLVSPVAILISKIWPAYSVPLYVWAVLAFIRYVRLVRQLPLGSEEMTSEQFELESLRGEPKPVFAYFVQICLGLFFLCFAIFQYWSKEDPDLVVSSFLALGALFMFWVPWWHGKKWERANNSLKADGSDGPKH